MSIAIADQITHLSGLIHWKYHVLLSISPSFIEILYYWCASCFARWEKCHTQWLGRCHSEATLRENLSDNTRCCNHAIKLFFFLLCSARTYFTPPSKNQHQIQRAYCMNHIFSIHVIFDVGTLHKKQPKLGQKYNRKCCHPEFQDMFERSCDQR